MARSGGERLTEGRGRQEGLRMRTSSNRAVGYGRVVSSLTAVIIIDYENKGLSQEHMLCVCNSPRRGDIVQTAASPSQLQELLIFSKVFNHKRLGWNVSVWNQSEHMCDTVFNTQPSLTHLGGKLKKCCKSLHSSILPGCVCERDYGEWSRDWAVEVVAGLQRESRRAKRECWHDQTSTLSLWPQLTPLVFCCCRHPYPYLVLPLVSGLLALDGLQDEPQKVTSHQFLLWLTSLCIVNFLIPIHSSISAIALIYVKRVGSIQC